MCFSATANFVGSGVLGTVGVVTLTKVKHRREFLFATLPTLFAVHQFTEGFIWLGFALSLEDQDDGYIFGAANLGILLVVDAIKRYAFTSVWCAYAAIASVIILIYFWGSSRQRPFLYSHS